MTNRPLVITLGAIGIAYIAALAAILVLYDGDKLAVAGILSGAMALLIPQMLSLKQSADNAVRIERTNDKIDANTVVTNTTHQIVNSQRTEMVARIDALTQQVADLRQERAVKASEMQHELGSTAQILAAITESTAPHDADAAAIGAAQAVRSVAPDAGVGETADAAALGAAKATKP